MITGYAAATPTEAADVERVHALLHTEPDPWSRDCALHLTASAVIVHPPTRRVLLRWHPRLERWLQVGGHGDPGEHDPLVVALREAVEETGLADVRPWPTDELVHVAVVPVPARGDEPAHEHADLRYVLATDTPDAARAEHPQAPLRWLSISDALAVAGSDQLAEVLRRVADLFAAA
jgi:8-oxo-dGTP pyrophosphatase MutT (NUDIX family)